MDDPAAGEAAAPAAPPSLTFAWLGEPSPDAGGLLLFYQSFQFCNAVYSVGDHVYLTPEDPGAPLYLARITAAFEDTQQAGGDRLCVEVQWYERRANMPAALQEGMHEREVVEWLQTDTNLVGCIERKATVIKARGYEEAAAQLPPEAVGGDWHFCRGVLEVDSMQFRTYEDVEADPALCYNQRTGQVMRASQAGGSSGTGLSSGGRGMQDLELFKSSPAGQKRGPRRRGGGGATTWDRAAGAAAALGGGLPPKPGTMCYECGAKQTPQWREGPAGPRTLCNACGMRYQRSQGKCITRPKPFGEPDPPRRGGYADFYSAPPAPPPASSPARPAKRGRGGGRRGRGGKGGPRAPWEGEDDDDVDYDPSFDRGALARGAGGYARHFAQYGSEFGDDDDGGGMDGGGMDAAAAAAAAAAGYFPGAGAAAALPPQLLGGPPPGLAAPGGALAAAAAAASLAAGGAAAGGGAQITPADLAGLVARAAAYVPALSEFAPALEAMISSLPPDQLDLLAGAKAAVESGLSEAKAADAAVAAVSSVLAQKKAAAERAHAGAAAAAAEFRDMVRRIVGEQQQQEQQQQEQQQEQEQQQQQQQQQGPQEQQQEQPEAASMEQQQAQAQEPSPSGCKQEEGREQPQPGPGSPAPHQQGRKQEQEQEQEQEQAGASGAAAAGVQSDPPGAGGSGMEGVEQAAAGPNGHSAEAGAAAGAAPLEAAAAAAGGDEEMREADCEASAATAAPPALVAQP